MSFHLEIVEQYLNGKDSWKTNKKQSTISSSQLDKNQNQFLDIIKCSDLQLSHNFIILKIFLNYWIFFFFSAYLVREGKSLEMIFFLAPAEGLKSHVFHFPEESSLVSPIISVVWPSAYLAHGRFLVNIWWVNEWISTWVKEILFKLVFIGYTLCQALAMC